MTPNSHVERLLSEPANFRFGSGPVAEEIRKLPFGEIF